MDAQSPEVPPAPSFDDLLQFLHERAPGFRCLVCGSGQLHLARERKLKGKTFRPSITLVGPNGPYQEYAFYTSCASCGAIQMFDLKPFRLWKQQREGGGDADAQSSV